MYSNFYSGPTQKAFHGLVAKYKNYIDILILIYKVIEMTVLVPSLWNSSLTLACDTKPVILAPLEKLYSENKLSLLLCLRI